MFLTLTVAQQECMKLSECSGITKTGEKSFILRTGKEFLESSTFKSWRKI